MTSLLEWLLGLDQINLARDAPLSLQWHHAPPGWVLGLFAIIGLGALLYIYRRERLTRSRKLVLAGLRVLLVGLVFVALCGPDLVLQRNRVERSLVALVVDTSQSMALPDRAMAVAGEGGDLPTRWSRVKGALLREQSDLLRTLQQNNSVHLISIGEGVSRLGVASSADEVATLADSVTSIAPVGRESDLVSGLQQVLRFSSGRRLAAVMLFSDGQSTESATLNDVISLARGQRVPVHAVRIGSEVPPRDTRVVETRAQDVVFADDMVAVEADVAAEGLSEPAGVTVQLVRDDNAELLVVLDQQVVTLSPERNKATVELHSKAQSGDTGRYRVVIQPLPDEEDTANNAGALRIDVRQSKLRVLYVEGYPRFEYRFLKNALLRERSVLLSVLLLEADDAFVQEGTEPIRRFPISPEELNRYDLVLFGDVDVRGGWLSAAQMTMLIDYVGREGGGFGVIAGERFVPQRFAGTPLEKLLPVKIEARPTREQRGPITTGFHAALTPAGRRSRLLRFDSDVDRNDATVAVLPRLFWIAPTPGPKPAATVLLEHPTRRAERGLMPLLVKGRYGAGALLFQATDDIWRWRRHTGELLVDAYWVQFVREIMRSPRRRSAGGVVLRSDRRRYEFGQPVTIQAVFTDAELLALQGDRLSLTVKDEAGRLVSQLVAQRLSPQSNIMEANFVPDDVGELRVTAGGLPSVAVEPEAPPSITLRVKPPNVEIRRREANHEWLAQLADGTGGKLVSLDECQALAAGIPDRSVRIPDDVIEPLWDSRLMLILFVMLIGSEWVLRKLWGLL